MFPEVSSGRNWEYRERQIRPLLQRASMVVVGTAAGQGEVERFYGVPPERIRRLPHPTPSFALVPSGETGVDPHERFGLPPDYLFYPAQLWAHKNHVTILDAARELQEKHGRKVALAFSGADKGNRAYLTRRASELGLADRVHFLGFVDRAELIGLYRKASALVYLSLFGPENLPPLEAFALGCPVVAARVAGAEEQLGDAAVLVDPTDSSAVAAALQRLFTEPEFRVCQVERGHSRAQRFTSDDFAAGLLELFDYLERFRRCWQ
jgi:glycosyltransferase involved in cell wall biosynthesis